MSEGGCSTYWYKHSIEEKEQLLWSRIELCTANVIMMDLHLG